MTWRCAACHLGADETERYHSRAIVCALCRDSAAARGLAWCGGRNLRAPHRVAAADMAANGACRACDAAASRARYHRDPAPVIARVTAYNRAHGATRRQVVRDAMRRHRARQALRILRGAA